MYNYKWGMETLKSASHCYSNNNCVITTAYTSFFGMVFLYSRSYITESRDKIKKEQKPGRYSHTHTHTHRPILAAGPLTM